MVLPGSLDHLYYGGVIDHIPYEAYYQPQYFNNTNYGTNLTNSNGHIQGLNYLDYAKQGISYNTYESDSFNGFSNNNFLKKTYSNKQISPQENYNGRSIKSYIKEEQDKFNSKPLLKGAISLGIMGLTLYGIFKGGKKICNSSKIKITFNNLGKKLNPKNWFSKK